MIGLITGSGFTDLAALTGKSTEVIDTDYGSVTVTRARWDGGSEVFFIPRHGSDHSVPPHLINYRANIAALSAVGVHAIIATAVSGAITSGYELGDLVLVDDFLNFTHGRNDTFFDSVGAVRHTEVTTAYDPDLRALIAAGAEAVGERVISGAVYSTFNGPRFESPAEIRMAERCGADLVGMTGYPEVVLARELGISYASIAIVSNMAAGKGEELSIPEIMAIIGTASPKVLEVIGAAVAAYATAAADPANTHMRMISGEDGNQWEL